MTGPKPKRSCNRHDDCDEADRLFKQLNPGGKWHRNGYMVYSVEHCDDSTCEECFGS